MAIKVFVSGICGSHDVRKTQQRVLFILSTLPVDLEIIDITEPGREEEKQIMQEEVRKHNKKDILPPQIFNGDQYCGNYDDFQLAADDDILMTFLKLEEPSAKSETISNTTAAKEPAVSQNGVDIEEDTSNKENLQQNQTEHKDGEDNAAKGEDKLGGEISNVEEQVQNVDTNVEELSNEIISETAPAKEAETAREESEEEESEEESD